MALAILGMPVDKIAPEMVRKILEGGSSVCATAGIPVAGGHSIDCPEPVYGLAVIGTCRPDEVRRNADAKADDIIILTKPLGVGIYSAAIKKDLLPQGGYTDMIATTTLLNRVGAELAKNPKVHAITDVTGFGLLGHGLEMARGSKLKLVLRAADLPLLPAAASLAKQGCVTGASHRNWASYCDEVTLPSGYEDWQRHLLTDPQTSGGLLLAVSPEVAPSVLKDVIAAGYPFAKIIGRAEAGPASIVIEA